MLDKADWVQPTSFTTHHCDLPSRISFMIFSFVLIDISFVRATFPFNKVCLTAS